MNAPIGMRRRRTQGGNAVVEFAMMAVVLLLFTCGVSDFARLAGLADMARGAAAAGTKYGALSPAHYGDLTGMQNAAVADTGNYPGATAVATQFCACTVGGGHVTCPASCGTGNPETYIQVVVSVPFITIFKYPWIPNPVQISSLDAIRVQ
jgi:Flp pilus assembly protein TadG